MIKCLKLLTFLPMEQIHEMETWKDAQLNRAKEILALELTTMIHGEEEAKKAEAGAKAFFGGGSAADMPEAKLADSDFADGTIDVLGVLVATGLCKTRSEARRAVEQGGVSVNSEKVTDVKQSYTKEAFAEEFVLQRGKKNFRKVVV